MKRLVRYIMATVSLLMAGHAMADDLTMSRITLAAGGWVDVPVLLEQDETKYAGFQFDLKLPDGVMLLEYGDGKFYSLNEELVGDMVCMVTSLGIGSYRIIVYSPTLSTFKGSGGEIMTLRIKALNEERDYHWDQMHMTNIMLSDIDGHVTKLGWKSYIVDIWGFVRIYIHDTSRFYGFENGELGYSLDVFVEGAPELSCEATVTSPVGSYAITASKGTLHCDSIIVENTGMLHVNPAPLTVSAGTYYVKQGEPLPDFVLSYDGFKNGENEDVLTAKPTATTTATSASEPGTYPIVVSGGSAQNYNFEHVNGTLIIVEADRIVITANSYTREYGEPNPVFGYTTDGAALDGEPAISCEATQTSPVGTYPIVISKGSVKNYNDVYVNGILTITQAPLTVSTGTYTIKQGEPLPDFVLSYSGFKNGETEDVLTAKPTATTTATSASEPGMYPIVVSGGSAQNYNLEYVNGTLTIEEADRITITANSYTRQYGEANPTFGYTTDGAALDGEPEITCEATPQSSAGSYPIRLSKGSVKNYNVVLVDGTLTIDKAPLTVTALDQEMEEGDELPPLTIAYDGFRLDETEEVLSVLPVAKTEATNQSAAGIYTITVDGGKAQNYELTYVNGTLTIHERSGIDNTVACGRTFYVYNMSGQLVSRRVNKTEHLPAGIYIVEGRKLVVK